MKFASKLALGGLPLALVACSAFQSDKVDYKASAPAPTLVVPPDLTQLPRDTRYTVPGTTVSAAGYKNGALSTAANANANKVAPAVAGVHMEGEGSLRWLVVDQAPEKVWPQLKEFWQQTGLNLIRTDQQLGIMETDWAENRAKLPDDFLRRTLGSVLDGLFSTGMLDRYRTRIERNAAGGTEVYISHQGLEEVQSDQNKYKTIWQPRAPDSDMEYEMLRRFMVKLGVTPEQSRTVVASVEPVKTSKVDTEDGHPIVRISDGFDRAWRRVGLTLDRTGFTVEDRDRSQGVYFVRYVEPRAPGEMEPGFFSKLFGSSQTDKAPVKYRVKVQGKGDSNSAVSLQDADGAPMVAAQAEKILKVIADDLL